MKNVNAARRQPGTAEGNWVLVDTRPDDPRRDRHRGRKVGLLLAVGQASYHGVAPRNALDHRLAQHLLRYRLEQAVREGNRVEADRVTYAGREWKVRVLPITSPVTGTVVAAMGCYLDAATDWATVPPPLVGSWEWRITEAGADHQNTIAWTDELFELYGLAPPDEERQPGAPEEPAVRRRFPHGRWWDGTYFLHNLVMDSWRPAVQEFRDRLLHDNSGGLHLCSFKTQHRVTGQPVALRLAGRAAAGMPGWFHGIATIDVGARENATSPTPRPLAQAFLEASRDPLIVVDRMLEELDTANSLFDGLNLAVPTDHHVRKLVHPFDVPALTKLLGEAGAAPEHPVGPQRLRLATLSAEVWREFEFLAVGDAPTRGDEVRYVVCRITEPA
ncbi:hypothetical protein GCM10017786_47880 [Amycolatopsis deserti]|uniref:Rv3651-like N-terminal domain-containing protein n=1 Tax=Amycolatopsis deserti TaxID=185696 RepID=A0ABQ3JAK5_9PSEU|nr:hypothetical protein GCM10017786_47880 [Amycolatopsis deserti]